MQACNPVTMKFFAIIDGCHVPNALALHHAQLAEIYECIRESLGETDLLEKEVDLRLSQDHQQVMVCGNHFELRCAPHLKLFI